MTALITIRIDSEMKAQIRRHGINVSETVRRALQEEVRRKEEEELARSLAKAKRILAKVPGEDMIRAVRESRDER